MSRRKIHRAPAALALALVAALSSCSSSTSEPVLPTAPTAADVAAPRLAGEAPCPLVDGFTCSTLRVPLDHSDRAPGTLDLAVAAADDADAPRGVLLLLTGGPGQPGVALLDRLRTYVDAQVLAEYRLVVLDQRGTGATALDCPALQQATGGSDFLAPSSAAVQDCAKSIGRERDFYTTPDTVRDIDWLRRALGTDRMTLDGVSYGTFTAAHYALTYPGHVAALVLDSVVPHDGFDPFVSDQMRATSRVLRDACVDHPGCDNDPAADLAWVVRHADVDGATLDATRVLEALSILSVNRFDPDFTEVAEALHAARGGDTGALGTLLSNTTSAGTPAGQLSAGLHLATLCADLRFPWGSSAAPLAGRTRTVDEALDHRQAQRFWPYNAATARHVLTIAGCTAWPPSRPARYERRGTLTVPTLILAGSRDLFTPLSWARREAAQADDARLKVFEGVGHGVQTDPSGQAAVSDFLLR